MRALSILSLVGWLAWAGLVHADPILDFHTAGQSGTSLVSYAGGSAPLVGSGINIQSVTGSQTSLNSGQTLTVAGGSMAFTSGSFTSAGASSWNFSGGGSFSITGGISSIGIAGGSNLLFNGTFTGPITLTDVGGNFQFSGAAVMTDVNPILAANYGFASNTSFVGGVTLLFTASGNPGDSFSSGQVVSGDLGISPPSVPEPSSLALLCFGSLLTAGFGWRIRKKMTSRRSGP